MESKKLEMEWPDLEKTLAKGRKRKEKEGRETAGLRKRPPNEGFPRNIPL